MKNQKQFINKEHSSLSIQLWKLLMNDSHFHVKSLRELIDHKKNLNFEGLKSQSLCIKTASSFLGIQDWAASYSMNKLEKQVRMYKIDHIRDDFNNYRISPLLSGITTMNRKTYNDVLMFAKKSSSSRVHSGMTLKDYVFVTPLNDILHDARKVEPRINPGFRFDRRGKIRLIFAPVGPIRVVEFLSHGHAYDAFHAPFAWNDHFIEGLSWNELPHILSKYAADSISIDMTAYERTITIEQVMKFSESITKPAYQDILNEYYNTQMSIQVWKDINIPHMKYLPSGMQLTHLIENVKQYERMIRMHEEGIQIKPIFNGDDHLSKNASFDQIFDFYKNLGDRPASDSIYGSTGCLNRNWFNLEMYPIREPGSLISTIFEQEGELYKDLSHSRFRAIYESLVWLGLIGLMHKRFDDMLVFIKLIIKQLNKQGIKIRLDMIPFQLTSVSLTSKTRNTKPSPKGLLRVKSELDTQKFMTQAFGFDKMYDLLEYTYTNNTVVDYKVDKIEYVESYTLKRLPQEYDMILPFHLRALPRYLTQEYKLSLDLPIFADDTTEFAYPVTKFIDLVETIHDHKLRHWNKWTQ